VGVRNGGDRALVARALAREEAGLLKGSAVLSRDEKKSADTRARQIQNDLSRLSPPQIVVAAYCVRRYNAGESRETIKATLNAAMGGESEAERKIFETVRDVLAPLLTKIRKELPLSMKTN
jgi:hypothetical protein